MKTYIVIVNWNGWRDTVECLESVFNLNYPDFSVIVCDNGSTDGSAKKLAQWKDSRPALFDRLLLLRSNRNLGFAGGNNMAIHHVFVRNDYDYVWLLNNDTVVDPNALTALVNRMKEDSKIGICGSRLIFHSRPDTVQAFGGASLNPVTGKIRHIGEFHPASERETRAEVESQMAYVVGASMLISKELLCSIGPLSEDYFLYYEELDLAMRAKGKFTQGYAQDSIVFHKQGNSMGTKLVNRNKGTEESFLLGDFYSIRNQLRFTRRYYPKYLLTVSFFVSIRLLKRIAGMKWKRAKAALRGIVSAFDPLI